MRCENNLEFFRNSIGKTPRQMAEMLGISLSLYYKLESGVRNPSYNVIKKFKKTFTIDVDYIFFAEKLDLKSKNPSGDIA